MFPDHPEALANTVGIAEQCGFYLKQAGDAARLRRAARLHHRELLREGDARRLRRAAARCSIRWPRPGACGTPLADYAAAAGQGDRRHPPRGLRRLLPDRLGLHPLRARARDPRRPRPRLGRRDRWSPTRLRITDIDPIEHDLIFERFLNEERISPPDIDIDFCENRRGEVIEYVTRKYGRENVAQIITFGTMKAKAVVRDVGPRARHELRRRRQDREDDPVRPEDDAGQGAGRVAAAAGRLPEGPEGQGADRHLAPAGGHDAARLHPRRRGRDLARAPDRPRAPRVVQGRRGGRHHAVRHEGRRAHRPPEDGLPGPAHADPHRQLREDDRGPDGRAARHRRASAPTTPGPTRCSRPAAPAACSSSSRTGCATS